MPLDDAAVARIDRFLALLSEWNRRVHLTGDRAPGVLVRRHVLDSLAPATCLPETGRVVDLGSGAGFPGIILACARPHLDVVLVESRRRPVSFLREAIRTVPLAGARALTLRAETAAEEPGLARSAAAVVSRALRLDRLLELAPPLLAPRGLLLAMQTPRTSAGAAELGAARGLVLRETRDYVLPGDVRRSLLVFTAPTIPTPPTTSGE